jgi:hypothetical protein
LDKSYSKKQGGLKRFQQLVDPQIKSSTQSANYLYLTSRSLTDEIESSAILCCFREIEVNTQ